MPINYIIENKCVITTGSGHITFQELFEFQNCLTSDNGFRAEFNELVDFSQITSIELTAENLKTLANISPFKQKSNRAFIMPNELSFGLSRMYEVYQESHGSTLSVFKTVSDATAWLNKHA